MECIKFIENNYVKFHLGEKNTCVYIDAVHAHGPKADLYTGELVYGVIKKTNCSGLIAKVSREIADLNRPICKSNEKAVLEYRSAIFSIINNLNILDENHKLTVPFLHIAIHGMKDYKDKDIEIGTLNSTLCSDEIKKWFIDQIKNNMNCRVEVDSVFTGEPSLKCHISGDPSSVEYKGYNDKYNIFQVEISRNFRENYLKELIELFSSVVIEFSSRFCVK